MTLRCSVSVLLAVLLTAAAPLPTHATSQTLAVFVQPGTSAVAARFEQEFLPAIREAATSTGAELRIIDAGEGAPPEVAVTPLVVYQNHRGRSIFQGRYADAGKVAHFVRTSRFVPQGSAPIIRQDAAVRQQGRARLALVMKVTGLSGDQPAGFDATAFNNEARGAIFAALTGFDRVATATLGRADRTFYLDFHPYRDAAGKLFISTEVYSQFNCHEPVFSAMKQPVEGSYDRLEEAFAQAARKLLAETERLIASSDLGDGFDPVAETVATKSWEEIGLALPPDPQGAVATGGTAGPKLGPAWRIAGPVEPDMPALQYKFPAPLDNYMGTASGVSGELTLPASLSLQGAGGFVAVDLRSVTMGEPGLDAHVAEEIGAQTTATARFTLKSVAGDPAPLSFGETRQILGSGAFELKGISIPLDARAEITPIATESGQPRLMVTASFNLRLKDAFGITGPDGPSPQNDTLEFFLAFLMEPAA